CALCDSVVSHAQPKEPAMIQPNPNGKQLYTQYEFAKAGVITPQMIRIAQREAQTPEFIRAEVARGRLVIPANVSHLAGAAGNPGAYNPLDLSYDEPDLGHPGARNDA